MSDSQEPAELNGDDEIFGELIETLVWKLTHTTQKVPPSRWTPWKKTPTTKEVTKDLFVPAYLLKLMIADLPDDRKVLAHQPDVYARVLKRVQDEHKRIEDAAKKK